MYGLTSQLLFTYFQKSADDSTFVNKVMSAKFKLLVATGSGFLAGFSYHKHVGSSSNDSPVLSKPGLPIFGSVSAASAAVLSPAVTQPAIPSFPEKTDLIPAEPPKGYSRVSEIMRFGFPGFDNIRSRR